MQLTIDRGELSTGLGGTQQKEFNIQRRIQIAYLDDSFRIARFLPDDKLTDDEAEESQDEEILFVFRRVADRAGADEDDEVGPRVAGGCKWGWGRGALHACGSCMQNIVLNG